MLSHSIISNTHKRFLHGLLGNKRNFASLASSLSTQLNQPRSIYTLDLRNHGENTHDWRDSMTYSEMARDVIAFMDKIPELNNGNNDGEGGLANGEGEGTINGTEKQKAVIVGHSMGGKVAQSLALMYPERVAGLVIIDIAPVRYYPDQARDKEGGGAWSAVEQIVRNVASIDLNEEQFTTKRDVDAVLRNGMLEDAALRAFVLTNLEQLRNEDVPLRWKIHWDGIVNELDSIAGFDVHDIVMDESVNNEGEEEIILSQSSSNVQYEGDVFFIHGGASRFVRHSYISTIASYFPNHMLTTIRGVGHWVHAEAPDDTIALLKRYLDR
jgi:esterase